MIVFLLLFQVMKILNGNIKEFLYQRIVNLNNSERSEEINEINFCSKIAHYDINLDRCIYCDFGKISVKDIHSNYLSKCKGCPIHYRYLKSSSGYSCIRCCSNMIASYKNYHNNQCCYVDNNYDDKDIISDGKTIKCSDKVVNSLGRDTNTPPLYIYCKCPNNMPKLFLTNIDNNKSILTCVDNLITKKIIDIKGLEYSVINYVIIENIKYQYVNCDPTREDNNIFENCLCPPKYIFIENMCKKCVNDSPIDTKNEYKCMKCSSDMHLSLDGKSCMCLYSRYPQPSLCAKEENNFSQCAGNFVLVNEICRICPNNMIKYNSTNECYCSSGKFISSNSECTNCPIGSFSSQINSNKCTKCPFFKTTSIYGSSSKEFCSKIIYYRLIGFILGTVLVLICICILAYVVFMIKKKKPEEMNKYISSYFK